MPLYNILNAYSTFRQHSYYCIQYVAIINVGVRPPTNVNATALSTDRIFITWLPSITEDVTGYLITYTTTDPFTSSENERVDSGSTTSYTLTNLEAGTLYTITVQAIDSKNRMSSSSIEVSETTYTASK